MMGYRWKNAYRVDAFEPFKEGLWHLALGKIFGRFFGRVMLPA
jgi:hypothetical protein